MHNSMRFLFFNGCDVHNYFHLKFSFIDKRRYTFTLQTMFNISDSIESLVKF